MKTLSLSEAADRLNVHPNRVSRMIHEGVLPAAKFGRAYVIREQDVDELIEAEISRQTSERMRQPLRT